MRGLWSRTRRRALGARVRAVALLGAVAAALVALPAKGGDGASPQTATRTSRVVPLAAGALPVFGAPPAKPEQRLATFVYLHGVCGLTQNGCGHFEGAPGWLVCPQANAACSNGGSAWGESVDDKLAVIDAALDASRAAWPESRTAPVVLVGFSQGAYVAMDVARARPGQFAGMLLLGADTAHGVDRIRAARVPRVALACGAYDMMFPVMRDTPRALGSFKIAAHFASLGRVGHTYAAEDGTDETLAALLAWLVSGDAGDLRLPVLG